MKKIILKNFKYNLLGNDEYKYIINSNVKYYNTKNGSEITLAKASTELITNLVYKEKNKRSRHD